MAGCASRYSVFVYCCCSLAAGLHLPILVSTIANSGKTLWLVFYQLFPSFFLMSFFTLSGMLIYFSCIRNIKRYGVFKGINYFFSRVFRVFPPLVFSLIFLMVIHFILEFFGFSSKEELTRGDEIYVVRNTLTYDWKNIVGSLLLLNTMMPGIDSPILNGPLWSLSHEFWFYMFGLGFVYLVLKNKYAGIIFFFIAFATGYNLNEFWAYGCLVWFIAFIMTHLIYNSNQRVANSIALGGSILSLILWIWFAMHYTESWYEYRISYIFGIGLSFCLPPILRFVKDRTFSPPLFLKAIAGVSKFAYTGYVLHFPFFVLVFV